MSGEVENELRFLVNGVLHTVRDLVPDLTLLRYLREDLGLTGTKEGCAEGACGACTVVVAEIDAGDKLCLRSLNACLQLLPAMDGKAVFTVEGLGEAGALHPVQEAMVRCHASQCGFCTPGFVMSLFTLFKNCAAPDEDMITDALSGNLCRCTGYRPIMAAAQAMSEIAGGSAGGDWLRLAGGADDSASAQLIEQLRALRRSQPLEMIGKQCRYFVPQSIEELARLYAEHPQAALLAGGTDLGLTVARELRPLPLLISVAGVGALREICEEPDAVVLGAAVSVAAGLEVLARHYPALAQMKRRFGGPAIRAAATIGGNIANGSPVGDSRPALMALGASLCLRASSGSREVTLDDFYAGWPETRLREGEFIESIRVPRPRGRHYFGSYKVSKRFDQDIAAVCAAFHLEFVGPIITSARVAFGGMDAVPRRAPGCEQVLLQQRWNAATCERAVTAIASDFEPISDLRGSRNYRRLVAGNLLRRFLAETTTATPMRIEAMQPVVP